MAQKVLTWSNSQINSFQVSCLLVHLEARIRVFRYQRCDICVDLHVTYVLKMAVLNIIRGWFFFQEP